MPRVWSVTRPPVTDRRGAFVAVYSITHATDFLRSHRKSLLRRIVAFNHQPRHQFKIAGVVNLFLQRGQFDAAPAL